MECCTKGGVAGVGTCVPAFSSHPQERERSVYRFASVTNDEGGLGGVGLLFGGGGVEPGGAVDLGKRAVLPLRGGHSISKVLLSITSASMSASTAQA